MITEKRKPGRPKKVTPPTRFIPIGIPAECKADLEEIRDELANRFGFSVSLGDAIRYLVRYHNGPAAR